MEGLQSHKKRARDGSDESELDLPEVKKIRDDLLALLDDSDPDSLCQGLDSVMKSFEQEISASSSSPVPVVDLTSESGESLPDLGYLLEASDDELGLPPSANNLSSGEVRGGAETELIRVDSSGSSGIGGELWGFEDQIPTYESFGLGVGDSNCSGEYVGFDDSLFEYSNVCFDSDFSDFSLRLGGVPTE
ncbi:T6J4.11 PROTEIN [Salix koriyanagi]|uniref:T6J4.11 PROTEIN n=1 Tax=Salix koriyanagi TaxID=2511006 RepID=A0A9Q0WN51_9ROSI|nr:T6J4.11 PROTEIN [Salix koriyanagi]